MEENIRIAFMATDDWYAGTVRKFLESDINHVCILFKSEELGGWWAIDVKDEVKIVPAAKAFERAKKVRFYECKKSLWPGLNACWDFVGTEYDWKGAINNGIKLIAWRLLRIRLSGIEHSVNKVFCSEHIALVIERSRIANNMELESSELFPPALEDYILNSIDFKISSNPLEEL